MPNEPDKKMDDLLKAYAQKRQADAGGPFELHPATRRALQAEAAKRRPKPDTKRESSFLAWFSGWSRLSWGLGVFAVVGVGVWVLVSNLRQQEELVFIAKTEAGATPPSVIPVAESQLQELDSPQPRREDLLAGRRLEEQPKKVALVEGEAVEFRSLTRAKPSASSDEFKKATAPADGATARVGAVVEPAPTAASGTRPVTQKPSPRPASRTDDGHRSLSLNVAQSGAPAELPKDRDALADTSLGTQVLVAEKLQAPSLAAAGVNADPALAKSFAGEAGVYVSLGNFTNAAVADGEGAGRASESQNVATTANATVSLANGQAVKRGAEVNLFADEIARTPVPGLPSAAPAQSGPVVGGVENETRLRRQSGQQDALQPGKDAAGTKLDAYSVSASQSQARNSQMAQERNVNLAQSNERIGLATDSKANTPAADAGKADSSARFYYNYNQRGVPTAILSNFDVEQVGDRVRIVDGDGSVYDGNVIRGEVSATARFGELRYVVPRDIDQRSTANRAAEKNGGAAAVRSQASSGARGGVGFQVSGTNRTSKMPVSFDGIFWRGNVGDSQASNADGGVLGRMNSATVAGAVTNVAHPPPVRRVVGRARVGPTNEIRIDALRSAR